jgi:hypothetical protein
MSYQNNPTKGKPMFDNFKDVDSYLAFADAPTLDDEVREQEMDVMEQLTADRSYE